MATIFKNKISPAVGTTPITALATDSTFRATVIGLSLANLTTEALRVSITVVDNTNPLLPIEAHYLKDVVLPANQSLRAVNGGEKLMIALNNELRIRSDVDASVDVIVSYVEIS
jgi:hypothetical protein